MSVVFALPAQRFGAVASPVGAVIVPPTANNATTNINFNTTTDLDVLALATPGTGVPTTIEIVTQPVNGVASVVASKLRFNPNDTFSGPDTIVFRIRDDAGRVSNNATWFANVLEAPGPGTFSNGYSKRARLRIPTDSVKETATYSDFPMYFDFTDADLASASNGGQVNSTSGFDIRFEDAAGIKIPHQLWIYNPANGRTCGVVRVSISNSAATTIFCYIGKSGLVATEENAAGVWSGDMVTWNARTGLDMTGGAKNLTPSETIPIGTHPLTGLFNGTTAKLTGTPDVFTGQTIMSVSFLAKIDSDAVGTNRAAISQGPASGAGTDFAFAAYIRSATAAGLADPWLVNLTTALTTAGRGWFVGVANQQTTNLTYVTIGWASGNGPQLQLNGVAQTSSSAATATGALNEQAGSWSIGGNEVENVTFPATGTWKGELGLFRFRNIGLTQQRKAAEGNSLLDPDGFYGVSKFDFAGGNQGPVAQPFVVGPINQGDVLDIDVLAKAFEPDGNSMTITAVSNGTAGTATIVAGKVRYAHAGAGGPAVVDSVAFTISDGTKTSSSKVSIRINEGDAVDIPELPIPLREVWSNAAFSQGITEAELTQILSGNFANVSVKNISGVGTSGPLQPGDHVYLTSLIDFTLARTGTGSFTLFGTEANPIVFRQISATTPIHFTNKIEVKGDYIRFWGPTFDGAVGPQLRVGGTGNQFIRCRFTGWTDPAAVTTFAGRDARFRYCEFYSPAAWSAGEISGALTDHSRHGMHQEGNTLATMHYDVKFQWCYFHDFPKKPGEFKIPPNHAYGTGQADACETPQQGPDWAQSSGLTGTYVGGVLASISTNQYVSMGWLFENCVFENILEGVGGTDGAGMVDFKGGGNIFRRCWVKQCGAGRVDARWGPYNTFEDILFEDSPGMGLNGWGHIVRRVKIFGTTSIAKRIKLTAGNLDGAGKATSVQYHDAGGVLRTNTDTNQAAQFCVLEDITIVGGSGIVIGAQGKKGADEPYFPARGNIIRRADPIPAVNDTTERVNNVYEGGTPELPRNIPTITDVGATGGGGSSAAGWLTGYSTGADTGNVGDAATVGAINRGLKVADWRNRACQCRSVYMGWNGSSTWANTKTDLNGTKNHLQWCADNNVMPWLDTPTATEADPGNFDAITNNTGGAYWTDIRTYGTTIRGIFGTTKDCGIMMTRECNSSEGYAWYAGRDNTSGVKTKFINAYRKVHDLLAETGRLDTSNYKFIFSLQKDPDSGLELANIYPGDAYVDIIGINIYDAGSGLATANNYTAWRTTWDNRFINFAKAHSKKVCFPEWGLRHYDPPDYGGGADNVYFIRHMHRLFRELTDEGVMFGESYFRIDVAVAVGDPSPGNAIHSIVYNKAGVFTGKTPFKGPSPLAGGSGTNPGEIVGNNATNSTDYASSEYKLKFGF